MKQVAILGIDHFGRYVLEELLQQDIEVLIIDKNKDVIDSYKDRTVNAIVIDILDVENLHRILPESIDAVIIDMGKRMEASILAASYCAKLKIPDIVAMAETAAHGEILRLVGATKIVFPHREAAKRITRQLMSRSFLNYMAINDSYAIAELTIPDFLYGKKLIESKLREKYGLNLIYIRNSSNDFDQCKPDYIFTSGDIGLFAGTDEALNHFTGTTKPLSPMHRKISSKLVQLFKK